MTHTRYLPEYNLCSIEKHHSWAILLNSMVFHTILISLLLYIWISTPRSSKTPFSHLIVRDGCLWYIAMLVPLLLTLIIGIRARSSLAALLFYFIWATTSISLSRLLLSMNDVQGPEEWGQTVKLVVPDIEFAQRFNYELNHSREFLKLDYDYQINHR
ncbi:putative transmembrane protein [Rhizoctonia solani 123E]|nr:putative transmembrane protein [Rhizoctonia solani 123E]